MILTILISGMLFAQNPCDKINTAHPEFKSLKDSVQEKIDAAANLVTIASEADQVLSKLIAAKSPVLLSWLNKRSLLSSKEEIIAQEWRKYYLNNYVLSRYPTKNETLNRSVENLFQEVNSLAFPNEFKQKVASIFSDVKKVAKQRILDFPMAETEKQKIRDRLDAINLYWFEKLEGTRFEKKPLEFIRWGVAYDPPANEINMGVHARQYKTDANLFAVLAHEMGHAIDPCRWSFYFKTDNPFQKVIQCLRSTESVAAQPRDDARMAESIQKNHLSQEMADSLKEHPTCNRSFYPPEGTQKDQILESFADWFSTEVYAHSSYVSTFPRPDLCEERKLMAGSSYPSNKDRLNKIYFTHPKLKKQTTHPPQATHCSLKQTKPMK